MRLSQPLADPGLPGAATRKTDGFPRCNDGRWSNPRMLVPRRRPSGSRERSGVGDHEQGELLQACSPTPPCSGTPSTWPGSSSPGCASGPRRRGKRWPWKTGASPTSGHVSARGSSPMAVTSWRDLRDRLPRAATMAAPTRNPYRKFPHGCCRHTGFRRNRRDAGRLVGRGGTGHGENHVSDACPPRHRRTEMAECESASWVFPPPMGYLAGASLRTTVRSPGR